MARAGFIPAVVVRQRRDVRASRVVGGNEWRVDPPSLCRVRGRTVLAPSRSCCVSSQSFLAPIRGSISFRYGS